VARRKQLSLALLGILAIVAAACGGGSAKVSDRSTTTTHAARSTTTSTTPPATTTSSSTATTTTSTGTSLGALTTRSQPSTGDYSVSLPASWQYANTTTPSDHQTNTWSNPADPLSVLTVVLSGCSGCVKASLDSTTPAPQQQLPAGATITQTVAPWQIFYLKAVSPSGYEDFGTVLVTHSGSSITGYVQLDLVVPSAQAATAKTILSSFTLS
jgi:hypothetical protein